MGRSLCTDNAEVKAIDLPAVASKQISIPLEGFLAFRKIGGSTVDPASDHPELNVTTQASEGMFRALSAISA